MSIFNSAIYLTDVPKNEWKKYIGLGYRTVCYTTDHEHNGQIILFGYDTEGNRKTFICPHKSWIKYNVRYKTNELDIYDNYVETKYFKNSYDRRKYIQNANGLHIIEALPPESEFLHMMFDDYVLDSNFNKQPMRVQTIDIETEISETFMQPRDAGNRINMITIYDSETNKYYTWSLNHAEINFVEEPLCHYDKNMFVFFEFNDDEIKMLEHFISWQENNYPDVSLSYNGKAYDWPYIVRRIENVIGKSAASRLSPVGKYTIKEVNHQNERADVGADIDVDIQGIFIADELVLYRDKFKVKQALDGGYGLSNVGEAEGLGHKIKYNGTLKDLYLKDYQKFYEYNVRDVDLLVQIEKKCKLIPLARQIAGGGLVNYSAIYSSISYLIGSIISYSKTKFKKTFKSYVEKKAENTTFEGAFVFPTIPGVYKGGIATIDFNSLYPSLIQAINASPETYKGKLHIYKKNTTGEVYEDIDPLNFDDVNIDHMTIELHNSQVKPITMGQLNKLLETRCIFTTNNTLFLKHEIKVGVISAWCKEFYALRKSNKRKELTIFHKLHNEEEVKTLTPEMINNMETEMENYHNTQQGFKIVINSVYGMFGTGFSPIFNQHIAQSITRMGKFCNRNAAKFIKDKFTERYNAPADYISQLGGDTDSCVGDSKVYISVIY